MKLTNQTILVTGGTSGIGKALAEELLAKNNKVIVTGRNEKALDQARQKGMAAIKCDLTKSEDMEQLLLCIEQEYPDLSVLINNAGLQYNYDFLVEDAPFNRIRQEVTVNMTAPILLTSMFLPLLVTKPEALIVNVTSALALNPKQDGVVYSATKAGIRSFTIGLRYQLEQTNVAVAEVIPPLVDTPMTAGRGKGKLGADAFAQMVVAQLEQKRKIVTNAKIKMYRLINYLLPGVAARMIRN